MDSSTLTSPSPHPSASVAGAARLAYFSPVSQQPGAADRKATFILAITGLVITTLLSFFPSVMAILNGESGHPALAWVFAVLLSALAVLLLAAVRWSYVAFVLTAPPPPEGTLCVLDQISAMPADEYHRRMRDLDHASALEAVLHVTYGSAVQGAGKFKLVNRALTCMRLALPIWMLLLLLIAAWR